MVEYGLLVTREMRGKLTCIRREGDKGRWIGAWKRGGGDMGGEVRGSGGEGGCTWSHGGEGRRGGNRTYHGHRVGE